MTDYTMEELVPIVAWLTDKYTSKESSSVSYEVAQSLMEAVLYCIREADDMRTSGSELANLPNREARQTYETGYAKVIEKTKRTKQQYHVILSQFDSYRNVNYEDSFVKAVAGFFAHYDARFAPQDSIITMDYPILGQDLSLTGIDAISEYVKAIGIEQMFLGSLSTVEVVHILSGYQESYRVQFYNIARVVLRHIVACVMSGVAVKLGCEPNLDQLETVICSHSKEEICEMIQNIIEKLVKQKYEDSAELCEYLQQDARDFASELYLTVSNSCLSHLFSLDSIV